jgi:NAD(P)-dependent dehydrogenase (short-subunit alcohol dehydrogenase family)
VGDTEEIAAQVVFLCSERASAINGAAQRWMGGHPLFYAVVYVTSDE